MDPTTEVLIRLSWFLGILLAFACLEQIFPRRPRQQSRLRRWPGNLGVSALNQVFVRLLVPATAVAVAAHAQQVQWGLLNHTNLPGWLEIIAAVLILDLAIYLQHRVYHAVPVLWRFHRMHHADTEFDVTTGVRFHPLSIVLSAFIKLAVVVLSGAAPVAVLVFEVLLNATSLFNHSNLAIVPGIDRVLRLFLVTPDMHRVHHSSDPQETNRNFGFNFPWWDRLFQTYRDQPSLGHADMIVGLQEFREPREQRLDRMLSQPFRGSAGAQTRG